MANGDSFYEVYGRLKNGDEDGAREVFERYAAQLVAQARGRLQPAVRQKVDPEDVVQSVFKSFFARQAAGQFEIENWDSMWGLLLKITYRKCYRWVERFATRGRDLHAEAGLSSKDEFHFDHEVAGHEPMPSEIAVLNELLDALMAELEPLEWNVFSLRLQGYDLLEIGTTISRSERTVRRILERVRLKLTEQLAR